MDFGAGDAGVIVDDGVDVGVAQKWVAASIARLAGCLGAVLPAFSAADVAPASAVGDVAEPFSHLHGSWSRDGRGRIDGWVHR